MNIAYNPDWVHYWTLNGTVSTTVYILAKMPHETEESGPDNATKKDIDSCADNTQQLPPQDVFKKHCVASALLLKQLGGGGVFNIEETYSKFP